MYESIDWMLYTIHVQYKFIVVLGTKSLCKFNNVQ
jgi:hypothetical protein